MMTKTQIAVDAETLARARCRASDLGISLAEYVRRLLAEDLAPDRPPSDPSSIFGLIDTGESAIATEKDDVSGAAVARERRRSGKGR